MTWKRLCEKRAYGRKPEEETYTGPYGYRDPKSPKRGLDSTAPGPSSSAPDLTTASLGGAESANQRSKKRRPKTVSYKNQFKQKYMVDRAWKKAGRCVLKPITPDQGVVTSLHLTPKYIVVALDNAKIHVFSTSGDHQKTLTGHVMGVWAMVPWEDTLVSGGCDRDVRVWNLATG